MKNKVLVYGASGYMGKLFAKIALENDLSNIVLAGRSNNLSIEAKKLNFETRIFSLDSKNEIIKNLKDVKLIINLAGPFSKTSDALIETSLETQTHYIDIAGEYQEFESAFKYNKQAVEKNIMIMPGAGFGVVPTDIAAFLAKKSLPSATHLKIGYVTEGGASRGTLNTVLKDINKVGIEVKNSQNTPCLPAKESWKILDATLHQNPWRADLFTAKISTEIPNISTYSNFPGFVVSFMKGKNLWLRNFLLKRLLKFFPEGPTEKQLNKGKTKIIAEVSNKTETKKVIIEGPEAYLFTAYSLIEISKKIMNNDFKIGFQTPSIYGKSLIENIKGVSILID